MLNKNILIITELFFPEEYVINDLAVYLSKNRYNVTVLTRNPSYPKGIIYNGYENSFFSQYYFNKIKIVGLKFLNNYNNNFFLKLISHLLYVVQSILFAINNYNKFDQIFFYQTGPLTNGICLMFFNPKIPKSIWIQDLWPETINVFSKNIFVNFFAKHISSLIYKRITNFFISCEGFSLSLTTNFNITKNNIHYAPNWSLNSFKLRYKKNFNNNKITILYAGNIGRFQNLERILTCFVNSECNNITFDILGDGSALKDLKTKFYNDSRIVFHNKVSVSDTKSFFEKTDFVILSLIENNLFKIMMPSKVQSYISTNRPIISIVSGFTNNFIDNYNLGFSSPSNNDSSIINLFHKVSKLKINEYNSLEKNFLNINNFFDPSLIIKNITTTLEK
jgi:hypothetical protein